MQKQIAEIGRVYSVNPARRELRIRCVGNVPALSEGTRIRAVLMDRSEVRGRVDAARPCGSEALLVTLGRGVPKDAVATMKGAVVYRGKAEADSAASRTEDRASWTGARVIEEDGTFVGTIVDTFETPAHGVLEIKRPGGGICLLPAVDEVIAAVDSEQREIVVRNVAAHAVCDED